MKELWAHTYYHNTVASWLTATATVIAVILVLHVIKIFTIGRLRQSVHKTDTIIDDIVLDIAQRTSSAFQVAVGLAAASYSIDLPELLHGRIRTAVILALILQAGLWGNGLVHYLIVGFVDRRAEPGDVAHHTGKNMLRFGALILVWSSVVLLLLDNVGVDVSTLIAGLGVTGVAVALATQNIVGDLFASISILLDKPFLVGDYIICDAFMGTVERIGVKTTRLRSLGGELVIMANSDLSKSRLRNYRHMQERRIAFNFMVKYETPVALLAAVGEMCQEIIGALPQARFDRANLLTLGDSGLQYEVVYYVLGPSYNLYCQVQEQINLALLRRFAEHNIDIAYRTIVNHNLTYPVAPKPPMLTM